MRKFRVISACVSFMQQNIKIMADSTRSAIIEAGMRSADAVMTDEDRIWSKYSNDKIDIGERLAKVIRTLSVANSLTRPLRALSIGSGIEPQFPILESAFRGGLYLLDIDQAATDTLRERVLRQRIGHVTVINGDYRDLFSDRIHVEDFYTGILKQRKIDLITLHHSLYYCAEESWLMLFENICRGLLGPRGALHAVLMAASSGNSMTSTWLYNHFAGKYFGVRNDQSLVTLKKQLETSSLFKNTRILLDTSEVKFFVDDFVKFMKVIWMILLYPDVHVYTDIQKEEIVSFVHDTFWSRKQPLLQEQYHLVVYRGIEFKGLI